MSKIRDYRYKIVEIRERILERLKYQNESGTVPDPSIDKAEIELLEARILLEQCEKENP